MVDTSKTQKLFSFIVENIENCKTTENKNELIKKFNEELENEKDKITQGHFGKTLRNVIAKDENLSFEDFGLKGKKESKNSSSGSALQTNFEDASVESPAKNIDPEIIKNDIAKNGISLEDAESGKIKVKYTVPMVSSFWVGLLRIIQIVVPEIEDFDEDEEKDLGVSTLPLFEKYLQYGFMEFLSPLLTVGSIFAKKIKDARKVRDEIHKKELEILAKSKQGKDEHIDTDKEKADKEKKK